MVIRQNSFKQIVIRIAYKLGHKYTNWSISYDAKASQKVCQFLDHSVHKLISVITIHGLLLMKFKAKAATNKCLESVLIQRRQ